VVGAFGIKTKENGTCGWIEKIEHGRDVPNVNGLGKFRGFFEWTNEAATLFGVNEASEKDSEDHFVGYCPNLALVWCHQGDKWQSGRDGFR
jgi:hypothetical protein